jgi:NADH-quinone oxidoreductase subunit G
MSEQKNEQQMVNLTINGTPVSVPKGTTVYHAAKKVGTDVPIFCYQDRMPPFGACRMCLVEVEKMGKLQTSCTLEATEGMVVRTESEVAKQGREDIIEFLLINHPLDCPICDRGGECPLQDNTMKAGPGESRFFEEKRHFKKPIPLGPVLMLDRERCITCARCTRFGEIVAGDHALEFIDRGFKTEVGTPDGGPAESKFIGNTIMICPVGALTSEVYRFRARPWDNEPTNTTCTLCPVGCSMILDARDGEIMRTRSLENKEVNDIWLCDKGWFGYEFNDHANRLQNPLIRRNGKLMPASWEEALGLLAEKMAAAKPGGRIAGLGGSPLTTEENYLFQQLMRQGAGVNNVDYRIGDVPQEMIGMESSIGDCEQLNYAFLFGIDLTEEFPVIWLRLKQAINKGAKVVFVGHYAPEIDLHLSEVILHPPGEESDVLQRQLARLAEISQGEKKGALFVGRQYLASKNGKALLSTLANARQSTANLTLNVLDGRGNGMGAQLAGMRPDRGPLGAKIDKPGLSTTEVIETAAKKGWDLLYLVATDLKRQMPGALWDTLRGKLGFLVVQDLFLTETARHADLVLPTHSFLEKEGTFINIEGRVQKIHPGKEIPSELMSDGEIFCQVARRLDADHTIDLNFLRALEGAKVALQAPAVSEAKISTSSNPSALLATFAPALFDHGVRMQHNKRLVQMAKEPLVRIHPAEAAKRKIGDGARVTLKANGGSLKAKIKQDKKVAERTLVLPLGFPELPLHELGLNLFNGMEIDVDVS